MAINDRLVGYEGNHTKRGFIAPNTLIRSSAVKVLEGVFEDDDALDQAAIETIMNDRAEFAPNPLPESDSEDSGEQGMSAVQGARSFARSHDGEEKPSAQSK